VVPEIRAEISLPVERTFHGKFGHDHDLAVFSGGFCRASGETVSVNLETAASLFAESHSRKRWFPLAHARQGRGVSMTAQVTEEVVPDFSFASALIETPLQACSCVEEAVPACSCEAG
jgi:hypothetical protein